jgi:predicted DNA-binding transcriptional regulator YafY
MNTSQAVAIDYTNWRGERSTRTVVPTGRFWFGSNAFHPEPQWLMDAYCPKAKEVRTFAMSGLPSWAPAGQAEVSVGA